MAVNYSVLSGAGKLLLPTAWLVLMFELQVLTKLRRFLRSGSLQSVTLKYLL